MLFENNRICYSLNVPTCIFRGATVYLAPGITKGSLFERKFTRIKIQFLHSYLH